MKLDTDSLETLLTVRFYRFHVHHVNVTFHYLFILELKKKSCRYFLYRFYSRPLRPQDLGTRIVPELEILMYHTSSFYCRIRCSVSRGRTVIILLHDAALWPSQYRIVCLCTSICPLFHIENQLTVSKICIRVYIHTQIHLYKCVQWIPENILFAYDCTSSSSSSSLLIVFMHHTFNS